MEMAGWEEYLLTCSWRKKGYYHDNFYVFTYMWIKTRKLKWNLLIVNLYKTCYSCWNRHKVCLHKQLNKTVRNYPVYKQNYWKNAVYLVSIILWCEFKVQRAYAFFVIEFT